MQNKLFVHKHGNCYSKLLSKTSFITGETVLDFSDSEKLERPNRISIDLGDHHIDHPMGKYINHSCKPTTKVCHTTNSLVTITDIQPGDEITFNYLESERTITTPFDCNCGSDNCVGRVEK